MSKDDEPGLRSRLLAQISIFELDRNRLSGKKVARLLREQVLRQGVPPTPQELAYVAGILHSALAPGDDPTVEDEGMLRVLAMLYADASASQPDIVPPSIAECRRAAEALKQARERLSRSANHQAIEKVIAWLEETR